MAKGHTSIQRQRLRRVIAIALLAVELCFAYALAQEDADVHEATRLRTHIPGELAFANIGATSLQQSPVERNTTELDQLGFDLKYSEALAFAATCDTDDDCVSDSMSCVKGFCRVSPLFPLTTREIIGTLAVFVSMSMASAGGIGGGGLLIPVYVLLFGLPPQDAIPLSKATIFGAAIANAIFMIPKSHPMDKRRHLIDYETVMIMEPMTLAGTIIGVYFNKIFPNWIITICLVLLLSKTAHRTYHNGIKVWKRESNYQNDLLNSVVTHWKFLVRVKHDKGFALAYSAAQRWKSYRRGNYTIAVDSISSEDLNKSSVEEPEEEEETETAQLIGNEKDLFVRKSSSFQGKTLLHRRTSLEYLKAKRNQFPWADLLQLLSVWVGLLVYSLAKGGHGAQSLLGLHCGTLAYWSLTLLAFPLLGLFTFGYARQVLIEHNTLRTVGYKYLPGDVRWDARALFRYPLLCMFAGVAAGMLGIGGGMVKGPLLLEMGLLPQVAAATSSFMILFTSSATTMQFMVLGMLRMDYATFFATLGFVSSVFGQIVIGYIIRKHRKTSIIVFIVAFIVGLSGTIMGVTGVWRMFTQGLDGFDTVC